MTQRRLATAAISVLALACGQAGPGPDACPIGEVRCKGFEVERCVRASSGVAEWSFSEACFGECSGGACSPGGACGCFGDEAATCGAPERQPVVVRSALPSGTRVPCDGVSRVLVHTEAIRSASGAPIPDGTMVTFTDGGRELITSADADSEAAGIQRPTLRGEAMVSVEAPASCAGPESITITATVLGRCAGAGAVEFEPAPAASSGSRPVYVVEDFTTTRTLDRAATTATWDASRGAAVSMPFADFGDGRDGDLVVDGTNSSAEAPYDLSASFAKTFNVIAVGPNDVLTDCAMPGVSAGDHVLLYTVWGQLPGTTIESAAIGTYEFKKVESARANIVVFTEPVRRVFGHASNADLAGHRVTIQRVPQFASVTIAPDGFLSSAGPTDDMLPATPALRSSGGSGVLAFRVKGRLSVGGVLTMDHKGMPVGVRHDVGRDPDLARIRLGNAGAKPGGGGLFVTASTLSFKDGAAFAPLTSALRANSDDGEGGMVWAMAGVMETNSTVPAIRFRAMGPDFYGRVCLDYARLDHAPASIVDSGGDLLIGQGGAFRVASTVAYRDGSPGVAVRSAEVLGVHGWPAAAGLSSAAHTLAEPSSVAPLSSRLPGFLLTISADDGLTWASGDSGRVQFSAGEEAAAGDRFRWRMDLANLDDRPMFLRAVAFRLELVRP